MSEVLGPRTFLEVKARIEAAITKMERCSSNGTCCCIHALIDLDDLRTCVGALNRAPIRHTFEDRLDQLENRVDFPPEDGPRKSTEVGPELLKHQREFAQLLEKRKGTVMPECGYREDAVPKIVKPAPGLSAFPPFPSTEEDSDDEEEW